MNSRSSPDTVVVGAGPFGLSVAAALAERGLAYRIFGRPMSFWRENMPEGMLLRSRCDWQLDPAGTSTIEAYLAERGLTAADVEPLCLDRYLAYTEWFIREKRIHPEEQLVSRIDRNEAGFIVALENGDTISAANVVVALGFRHFPNLPTELVSRLAPDRFSHTVAEPHLARFTGRRVLIVGGRQSAFESAALLGEADAAQVHVCYRHDTPAFTESDWSWFNENIARTVDDPGWFRRLSDDERKKVNDRFWAEGRLKLEPWLAPRLERESIVLWPRTEIARCTEAADGSLEVELTDGSRLAVDHVLLATGYKVDLERIPLLERGNVLDELRIEDGFPVLDTSLQTSVPGLYVTSIPATRDFGLFFAFTISATTSATLIANAIAQR